MITIVIDDDFFEEGGKVSIHRSYLEEGGKLNIDMDLFNCTFLSPFFVSLKFE